MFSLFGQDYSNESKQKDDEFNELLEILVARNVKNILEIGTFTGRSARDMAQATGGMVVTVDPNCIEFEDPNIISICGISQSEKVIDAVSKLGPFDFILIDGDHRRSFEDFEIYKEFLNNSGLVGFHDINPLWDITTFEVIPVWEKLKEFHQFQEIISTTDLRPGYGIGLIFI